MNNQSLKNKTGMLKKSELIPNGILVIIICGLYIGLVNYI